MEKRPTENPAELLAKIRAEGMTAIEELYQAYREEFVQFAARYNAPKSDVLDAWQDAIIAFYENVMEGKLTSFSSSPKTYIFSIGKYILLNKLKAEKRFTSDEVLNFNSENTDNQLLETIDLTHQQQSIQQALDQLGGQCRELLVLFYYNRYSIKNIQTAMNYSSENTVKASKSRCMKSLKEIMQKMTIY